MPKPPFISEITTEVEDWTTLADTAFVEVIHNRVMPNDDDIDTPWKMGDMRQQVKEYNMLFHTEKYRNALERWFNA